MCYKTGRAFHRLGGITPHVSVKLPTVWIIPGVLKFVIPTPWPLWLALRVVTRNSWQHSSSHQLQFHWCTHSICIVTLTKVVLSWNMGAMSENGFFGHPVYRLLKSAGNWNAPIIFKEAYAIKFYFKQIQTSDCLPASPELHTLNLTSLPNDIAFCDLYGS